MSPPVVRRGSLSLSDTAPEFGDGHLPCSPRDEAVDACAARATRPWDAASRPVLPHRCMHLLVDLSNASIGAQAVHTKRVRGSNPMTVRIDMDEFRSALCHEACAESVLMASVVGTTADARLYRALVARNFDVSCMTLQQPASPVSPRSGRATALQLIGKIEESMRNHARSHPNDEHVVVVASGDGNLRSFPVHVVQWAISRGMPIYVASWRHCLSQRLATELNGSDCVSRVIDLDDVYDRQPRILYAEVPRQGPPAKHPSRHPKQRRQPQSQQQCPTHRACHAPPSPPLSPQFMERAI